MANFTNTGDRIVISKKMKNKTEGPIIKEAIRLKMFTDNNIVKLWEWGLWGVIV